MDAARLLSVLVEIGPEIKNQIEGLQNLIQQYATARDNPTQDLAAGIQAALEEMTTRANASAAESYPPSKRAVLRSVGGVECVGSNLVSRVDDILSIRGQTTAAIVSGLEALQGDLQQFQKACQQTRTGLSSLGIEPHVVPEGEFEVGVLIPEDLVDRHLGDLAGELEEWNRILRTFQEIAGESEREVTVSSLSSGSYEMYVSAMIATASFVSMAIDKVLDWYLKILEIRRHRMELERLGVPQPEVRIAKNHEREILESGITELVAQILEDSELEAGRRSELEIQLKLSVRKIAKFVDRGGDVEVNASDLEEPEEPLFVDDENEEDASSEDRSQRQRAIEDYERRRVQLEAHSSIREAGASLSRLPPRSETIFQIGDGDEAAEQKPKVSPKKK